MDARYRGMLGYLPQEFGYYPDFTVKDYLMYIASIKGLRPATAKKRVKALLAKMCIRDSPDRSRLLFFRNFFARLVFCPDRTPLSFDPKDRVEGIL